VPASKLKADTATMMFLISNLPLVRSIISITRG
jgi:hypothetical protein